MSDLDLERLGDVWRQQPTASEMADLQRAAETVRRRARWALLADALAATAVAVVVGLLVLSNPRLDTLLVGGGAILVLLAAQVRQRKLRTAELKSLTGTSEEMLDQSIERLEAAQTRVRFGAISLGPAFFIGLLVAHAAGRDAGGATILSASPGIRKFLLPGVILVVLLAALHNWRSYRRNRQEMERLTALRDAYRSEQDSVAGE